jgi:hypothetical protein
MPRSRKIDLAHRRHDGLEVTLWWSPADGAVTVEVQRDETSVVVAVEPHRALDAFYHPFAYGASRSPALLELTA